MLCSPFLAPAAQAAALDPLGWWDQAAGIDPTTGVESLSILQTGQGKMQAAPMACPPPLARPTLPCEPAGASKKRTSSERSGRSAGKLALREMQPCVCAPSSLCSLSAAAAGILSTTSPVDNNRVPTAAQQYRTTDFGR